MDRIELYSAVNFEEEIKAIRIFCKNSCQIWYDALSLLSDQVEAHPDDKALRQTRADLLRQVGLKAAAGFEGDLAKK